jgi:uncharacterized protein with ParB-like and HNH nuclease domain
MSDLSQIKIDPEGLGHVLKDGQWAVPRYQRAYKWEGKQVTELLYDLENAIQDKQAEYFVGSIVVAQVSAERAEIVDGQQRLATASILLAGIRDFFVLDRNDKETADIVQAEYLFRKDLKTKERVPKLQLSDTDHDFFLRAILEPPSKARKKIKPTRESHKRLLDAQRITREYLLDITKNINNPDDKLFDRINYLADKTRVIWVQVPDHQNAFTIFETLNDRGLDLAITDLLKNYLFHKAQDRIGEVQQRWVEMFTMVETAANEETVKDYIRHLWSSHHGLTRERELYKKIKDTITTKSLAFEYSGDLLTEAKLFSAIRNNNHEFWTGYGTATRQHVDTITDLLGMERITPLLLAILASFTQKEIEKSLRMIVGWGVRLIVAGGVAGALERKYSDTAVKIRQSAVTTSKQLLSEMKDVIPGDADFEKAFATAKVSKALLARYYLHVLERQELGQKEPELVPNTNEAEVNLEHVLPQNPSPGSWVGFDADARVAHTYRIGNLALMKVSDNAESGTEEFAEKKKRYLKSSFTLTKMIAASAEWTPSGIDSRQNKLAALAVKAWPQKI